MLYTIYYTLYTIYYTLNTIYYTLYTIYYILYTIYHNTIKYGLLRVRNTIATGESTVHGRKSPTPPATCNTPTNFVTIIIMIIDYHCHDYHHNNND